MDEIKVKHWYQSVSIWIALVASVIVAIINALVENGAVAENASWVMAALAIGSIFKRGIVEAGTNKGNALLKAASIEKPADPS